MSRVRSGYLIQQGPDGACVYWNADFECSPICASNSIVMHHGPFFDLERATAVRDLWEMFAGPRCTFKIVEVEYEPF